LARRAPSELPVALAAVLAVGGTAALWSYASRPATTAAPPAETTPPAAASASPSSASPRGPTLAWRVEGLRADPDALALADCVEAHFGERPLVVPMARGFGLRWSALRGLSQVEPEPGTQGDWRLTTPIEGASSASLRAQAALLSCARSGAARLVDLDLGRTFDAETFRAGSRPGALDPERFLLVEAQNGTLVTRGLARFSTWELELAPGVELDWPTARVRLLSCAATLLAAGFDAPSAPFEVPGQGRFALEAVSPPPGFESVRRLVRLDAEPPRTPRARSPERPPPSGTAPVRAPRRPDLFEPPFEGTPPRPTRPPRPPKPPSPLPSMPEYR